jgi:hypothetical protein
MNTANTYKCPKCNGSGFLSQYSGIANGVCFSCEGNGFKIGVAPVPGVLFTVTAVRKADAARVNVFNTKAKSAAEALRKAIVTLSKGNGYIPESAEVVA